MADIESSVSGTKGEAASRCQSPGSLAVIVKRADTGAPIPGAEVALSGGPTQATIPTDDAGTALFSECQAGDYVASVVLKGAVAQECADPEHVLVSVASCESKSVEALALPKGELAVLVRRKANSAAIPGAEVTISGPISGTQKTNAEGLARWSCGPGRYVISIALSGSDATKYVLPPNRTATVALATLTNEEFQLVAKPTPSVVIDEPKIVLVKRDYQGKPKPGVKPHRMPVKLSIDEDYDGSGELSVSHPDRVRVFEKEDDAAPQTLPWKVPSGPLKSGKMVYVEASKESAALADEEIKLTLKDGTVPPAKTDASEKFTCVLLGMDIYKARPDNGADPVMIDEGTKVDPGRSILTQGTRATRLWAQRAKLVIKQVKPSAYAGKLVLKAIGANVEAFPDSQENPAAGQSALRGDGLKFDNAAIDATKGTTLWVQGKTTSGAMGDTGWTLELEALPNKEGDRVTMTVLKAELAVYQSRKVPSASLPNADLLSDDDKFDKGRFVHIQDGGFHHGRAGIVVKKVVPNGFTGTLVLSAWDAVHVPSYRATKAASPKVGLFSQEVAAAGQAAQGLPLEIDHPAAYPADGKTYWVQGSTVSGGLRDCELRLGVKEVDNGCDRAEFTVVRLKNLRADIPSTPAGTNRLGNSPVNRHDLRRGSDVDEDYAANPPLVLVEGSVTAGDPIVLTTEVEPANVPVVWDVVRDTRAAPNGDHANVVAMSPHAVPTITRDAGNRLRATLLTDATGSFHVCPFVDGNGTDRFDFRTASGDRIDREPYLMLNLVSIRVQGYRNTSQAHPGNCRLSPAVPTAATGVGCSTGRFNSAAVAGIHNSAQVEVIGGGADGLRGLDSLFAGWVNNESTDEDVVSTYRDPAPPHAVHTRQSAWWQPPAHANFQVYPPPAPVHTVQHAPVLDTTNFGNEGTGGNTCVGTEGAVGPPVAIAKVARPGGGQRWTVEMWDSPGDSCPAHHEGFPPAALATYRFNLNFRSDLVVWTNIAHVPGPTPDPACRLYSSVQTDSWTIRFDCTFDAAGNIHVGTPLTIALTQDANTTRISTPVVGSGLEVRGPVSLNLLIVDSTA